MSEYKFTEKDYKFISEQATREFIENTIQPKQDSTFLVKCVINSTFGYLKSNNLEVKNGQVSHAETEDKA